MTIHAGNTVVFSQPPIRCQSRHMHKQRVLDLQDAVRKAFGAVAGK